MIDQLKKIRNSFNASVRKRKQESFYHKVIGKHIIADLKTNDIIYKKIIENKPYFISRFGSSELATLLYYQQARLADPKHNKWNEHHEHILCDVSGFFPFTEEAMDRFCKIYLSFIDNIDMLGVWNIGEQNIAPLFHENIELVNLPAIEPYYFDAPWSRALAGKKVLVIHPFAESIKQQYAHKALLFKNNVLPDFELQVIAAVQSIASNTQGFKSWFEAFEFMCDEVTQADFDVAIIGAGAYGMPLANFVKMNMGKVAIHMGGATQILFGIKGRRWYNVPKVKALFNENWISPAAEERPVGAEKVEGGSYW